MNNQHQTKIIYNGYARKSSEAEDKQALSIESQVPEINKISSQNKVLTTDILTESKSAKNSFGRPVFEQLIKRIENGEVQGIIAWHANRLSRNAIDAARLVDLFDKEKLREIITQQQVFRNTPQDKFMLTLFCSQAKMENDNKSIDVKRGLRKKRELGYPAGIAKIGYINDFGEKGKRRILSDPDRFHLVKQLLLEFLTGKYSVRRLHEYAKNTLGLKNIQRDKEGGNPIALSHLHLVLKDPFYAGFFFGKDENDQIIRYKVNETVPRIISEEQYWLIQSMLGGKGNPRPKTNKNEFPYIGRTKCGTCGGAVTAEHKHQLTCSNCKKKFAYKSKTHCPVCNTKITEMKSPKYAHYIYYHCTKRRMPTCPERSVYQSDIDEYLAGYFESNLKISPDLRDWSIKHLSELTQNDKQNEFERKDMWLKQKEAKEKEYSELIRMKMRGAIDEDDFLNMKTSLKSEIENITRTLSETGSADNSALERAKKAFNLAVGISEVFQGDDYNEKVEALATLRSNLTLKEKKLSLSTEKLYSILIAGIISARQESPAFEPANWSLNKGKTERLNSVCPSWL
ncbi:MAG: recombinase family protein [Candidatus Magasanikbacteria bacterium]|nr:recombinase family protein [Candidatus Magasanikbacteria bacterium]